MADEYSQRDVNFVPVITGVTDDASLDIRQIRVDPVTGYLKIAGTVEGIGHSSIGNGSMKVSTAGTAEQLSTSSVDCKRVWVQSYESNGSLGSGGIIAIGGSTSVRANSTGKSGRILYPTQGDWFSVTNLNLLYVNSTDNNAKVNYYYEN